MQLHPLLAQKLPDRFGQSDGRRLLPCFAELLAQLLDQVGGEFQIAFGRFDRLGSRLQFLGQPRVFGGVHPQLGKRLHLPLNPPGLVDGPLGFGAAGLVQGLGQLLDVLLGQRDFQAHPVASQPHEFDGLLRLIECQFGLQGGDFLVEALQARLKRGPPGERHRVELILGCPGAELLSQIATIALSGQEQFLDLFAAGGTSIRLLFEPNLSFQKRVQSGALPRPVRVRGRRRSGFPVAPGAS